MDTDTLQLLVTTLLAVIIPFFVSKLAWPWFQAKMPMLKASNNVLQQFLIVVLNAGLAFGAMKMGLVIPMLEEFAMSDMQAVLTAAVGMLTTVVFKQGKASALPPA